MSRSYKKTPVYKSKEYFVSKRAAAKKARNTKDLPDGMAYKKVVEQYDINDIISYWSETDARLFWRNCDEDSYIRRKYKTEDNFIQKSWAKTNYRK